MAAERNLNVRNPFSLTAAAKFAAFFAVVLLAAKIAQEHFSERGLYVVAALPVSPMSTPSRSRCRNSPKAERPASP